jgi:hypothetical protein
LNRVANCHKQNLCQNVRLQLSISDCIGDKCRSEFIEISSWHAPASREHRNCESLRVNVSKVWTCTSDSQDSTSHNWCMADISK